MDPIVGRIYRRQEYQQPWWLTALGIFGSMVGLLYFAFVSLQAGQAVWGGYSGIAPPRQQYIGHLTAMAMGLPWLSWSYWRWRERLFLAPAMRDLVTTPATPWQVLKIATRFSGVIRYLYSIAFVLFLFPWFRGEWLLLITATRFSTHWVIPLALVSAAVAALLISGLNAAIGISLNIFTSAIGFGGVAARFRNAERAMLILKRPIFYTLLMGLGLMLIVALVGIAPYSVPAFSNSSIWSLGQSLNRYFERPDTIAHAIMVNFPTVVWFDAMTHSTNGNADIFRDGIQGCIAWLAGAALLSAVFLNRGLSMSVRAGWYGVPDPTPADASKPQPRSFDPDRSNGPLEAWLLNRIGRMGRATLRLMAQNFEAGSIDMHLKRSVLLAAPCIAIAYAAKYLVPEALEIPLQLFNNATLGPEKEPIGLGAAAMCVVFMGLYRMQLWSTWRAAGSMLSYTPRQSAWQLQGFQFRRAPVVVTRGDARHPACEVYAVGLKDAVLLPTFYTVAWLFPVIGISALEALAVGLPPANVGWTFLIALPALAQLYYLGILVSMISYWMDYSRSRVLVFFKGIAFGSVFGSLIVGLAVLIAYLCSQCIEHNRPAVAWLGCINITLVFDVALYSFFRWVYIRRRFDAERMQPRTMV